MKIYFAGSIRGGRDDQELYFSIIKELQNHGTVLTEHLGNKDLSSKGEEKLTDTQIFERDMEWVREADIIVAEVSTPSLGVGYELGQAESMGKRIVCLHRNIEGKLVSAMLRGNKHMEIHQYATIEDVKGILAHSL